MTRPRIYQLFVRVFGNANATNAWAGDRATNGCGRFHDVDDAVIDHLRRLHITHVWLTGVIRHATLTAHPGLPADDPDVVKGRAGSPYAITDYYDVNPDLARDPVNRVAEFRALVDRLQRAGLRVLVDFVPNHVGRAYASTVHPERDFGRDDDRTVFFSPRNDFFHLVHPPGQHLHLQAPSHWHVDGMDGRFPSERPPRATGNNQTGVNLGPHDWYDAVKLNYGFNFADRNCAYDPRPPVWDKMDAILAHWQALGVDGFRCDFAHWIPVEFWAFAIGRARQRNPGAFFLAEAYDDGNGRPADGSPPHTTLESLVTVGGFDAVYDHAAFGITRRIASGVAWANDLSTLPVARHWCRYVENHDERRAASPLHPGAGHGDTGYGSFERGNAMFAAQALSSRGPVLVHAGQELGEDGAGNEGYGGEDGRTTIFDYWSPPLLRAWHANRHNVPRDLHERIHAVAAVLATIDDDAFHANIAPLNPANQHEPAFGDHGHWLYACLRWARSGDARLVVVNLHDHETWRTRVRIPRDVAQRAGLTTSDVTVEVAPCAWTVTAVR